jgi:hypothetical protein
LKPEYEEREICSQNEESEEKEKIKQNEKNKQNELKLEKNYEEFQF